MHIVIVGNGISGITAARWIRKLSDYKITVISSESDHFFSRTALMYIYMGHMRYEDTKPYEDWFWNKNNIHLLKDHVQNINYQQKSLSMKSGNDVTYDKLILAVGSKSNKFGWPGQDLDNVSGLYHLQDLEKMEAYSSNLKRAAIVGGGLIGIEMAEMFHSRNIPVSLIVRERSYWDNVLPLEESVMVTRHIKYHGFDLRLSAELEEISDDGTGKAGAIKLKSGEEISCGYVGLTAGVSPNVTFLKDSELNIERGVVVDKYLTTNIPDVYAIGDCAQVSEPVAGHRPIEAVWYTGRMMGETAAYNICGKQIAYDPGIWFNSAKFLDIEYQVYGDVPNKNPDHMQTLYWEHKGGEKSIRINYHKDSGKVLGFNLMGIRFRHEVCEKWIKESTHIEVVLKHLAIANFDPEFYKQHEGEVVALYNKQAGKQIKHAGKRNLNRVFQFLRNSNS